MSEKPREIPNEINFSKDLERKVPEGKVVSEKEVLGLYPETETSARVLTQKERDLLEKETGIKILEDKPELLYFTGSLLSSKMNKAGLEAVKEIVKKDKVLISIGPNLEKTPSLNEAIDAIITRRSLREELIEKFGDIKTDRSIMDKRSPKKDLTKDEYNLGINYLSAGGNGIEFLDGFFEEHHIDVRVTQKLGESFMLRRDMELCSQDWLELNSIMGSDLKEVYNLSKTPFLVLENLEDLKKAIEIEKNNSLNNQRLQRTIDTYFNGDVKAFQKRWKEYYENWWPSEYIAMQDCVDKIKEWLKTQKEENK